VNPAYVTAIESQSYLAIYTDWLALTDVIQDGHLQWGRVYIDSEYLCPYDETDATDHLKQANSFAGYMDFKADLFANVESVKTSSVAAGSVSSSKTYQSSKTNRNPLFNQVRVLLTDCVLQSEANTVRLSRV